MYFPQNITYKKIFDDGVKVVKFDEREYLKIDKVVIERLTEIAFKELQHYLKSEHLQNFVKIIESNTSTNNEKLVCKALLKNAIISAEGILPLCQDTGTATIYAWRGDKIISDFDEIMVLQESIKKTWSNNYFRYSQVIPLSMFDEKNSNTNLPAQLDITYYYGNEYKFLFVAKGGGSSNKTTLIQGSKAILNEEKLKALLTDAIHKLGVAACPPYKVAVVVGGTSPENNLKTLKLATADFYDDLPTEPTEVGMPFRVPEWEKIIHEICSHTEWGAQFGGRHLASDVVVIRLPRHAGSCPISIGVSCNAHRNMFAKINSEGVYIQELDHNPARFAKYANIDYDSLPEINLYNPIENVIEQLTRFKVGTIVRLNGPIIVARDIAHARIYENYKKGLNIPSYLLNHPIYYAGPAKTPPNYVIGSFGPTTAQRMDDYADFLMSNKASLVSIAKGNRSKDFVNACKKYGGYFLATIGGAAALISKENVKQAELIDFEDLGMEAIYKIVVKDMLALIVYDKFGNSFYS